MGGDRAADGEGGPDGEFLAAMDALRHARARSEEARQTAHREWGRAQREWDRARAEWERFLHSTRVLEARSRSFVVREPGLAGRLTLRPKEDRASLSEVRAAVCAFLREAGVPEVTVSDLEFVVGELCSNVARHARSSEGRFLLAVDRYPERIVVTVKDGGPGFSPEHAPAPGSDRPDGFGLGMRIGGLGLPLVAKLAETVEFRPLTPCGTMARAVVRVS